MDLARNLIQRINVGDALTRAAAARPSQPAIVDGPHRWTYAELNAWVSQLARGLADRGYRRGDAIGLASGNSAEFLAVYYACARLGLVCVPVNLGWRPDEVAYVLGHSRSRGLVIESQLVAPLREAIAKSEAIADVFVAPGTAAPGTAASSTAASSTEAAYEAEPADRAWATLAELASDDASGIEVFVDDRDALSYLYTSGTTAFPKGVVASHAAVYLESMSAALDSQWSSADRFAAMMPMFHTAQLNAFCTPAVLVGATTYLLRGFDPAVLLDLIEGERITQVFGLPISELSHQRSPMACRGVTNVLSQ